MLSASNGGVLTQPILGLRLFFLGPTLYHLLPTLSPSSPQAGQGETATWTTLRVKDLSSAEWRERHQLGHLTSFWLSVVARVGTGTSIRASLHVGAFKVFRNLALYRIPRYLPTLLSRPVSQTSRNHAVSDRGGPAGERWGTEPFTVNTLWCFPSSLRFSFLKGRILTPSCAQLWAIVSGTLSWISARTEFWCDVVKNVHIRNGYNFDFYEEGTVRTMKECWEHTTAARAQLTASFLGEILNFFKKFQQQFNLQN